ncbi:acetyltransferase [Acidovorax sp. NCPPB 2350]|nr:acetyltransferase [Acidovorax sp. NCPPB 2350]
MKHAAPHAEAAGTPSATAHPFISYADGRPHTVHADGDALTVADARHGTHSSWRLAHTEGGGLALSQTSNPGGGHGAAHALAVLDAAFSAHPGQREIALAGTEPHGALAASGVLLPRAEGGWNACRDTLWQQPGLWLPETPAVMAQRFALTNGKYHPRRAPKPTGLLYQRFIPWLGQTFSFRCIDREADLPLFHRWMNDPDVALIWEEEGDLDQHRAYLEGIARDPHMYSMIASLDGVPFAYFEIYWARESRIAPFYDVHDYDRGWHVLVGDPAYRGKAFATAWLTAISHYIFLCDPRTQRAMGEPRIDHQQQIRNLDKSGYAKVKEFDLPHKRAQLVMLLREHYFYDGLWMPRA